MFCCFNLMEFLEYFSLVSTCGGELGFFSADVDASRIGLILDSINDVLGVGKLQKRATVLVKLIDMDVKRPRLTHWNCCYIWRRGFSSSLSS